MLFLLGETMTSYIHSEFNWPLLQLLIKIQKLKKWNHWKLKKQPLVAIFPPHPRCCSVKVVNGSLHLNFSSLWMQVFIYLLIIPLVLLQLKRHRTDDQVCITFGDHSALISEKFETIFVKQFLPWNLTPFKPCIF